MKTYIAMTFECAEFKGDLEKKIEGNKLVIFIDSHE